MKTVNELILESVKKEFERMEDDQHIWVMTLAAIPFSEVQAMTGFLPYDFEEQRDQYRSQGVPTHMIRVVLRTSDTEGPLEYVDGTDIYMIVDTDQQFADCNIWAESWVEGPPKFEGGPIESALAWARQMAEPFCVQMEDPFLTAEQRAKLTNRKASENQNNKPKAETRHEEIDDEDWI